MDPHAAQTGAGPSPAWKRPGVQVAAVIVFAALVKLAVTVQLELISPEAYLWMCARHLALGYYDYPGMMAWLIWLSTRLFGDAPLGVRLFTIAGGGLMTWWVFLAARRLYDERVGRLAAFLAALTPITFAYGSWATPDAPLLLFWAGALWALAHLFSGGSPRWWYAAGLFLGLAMLSKYHGFFIGAGTLLFLLLSPDHRGWLRRKEPYMAALVALAVFSPTILWNAENGWASFRYQGVSRFGERSFDPKELVGFPYSQLVLVTPFVCAWAWGAGLWAIARWKTLSWQDRFAASMGMSVLLFFAGVLFLRPIRGHWPAPGYVGALILSAAVVHRGGRWGRRLHHGTLWVLAAAGLTLPAFLAFVPREKVTGWAQLAREVARGRPEFVLAREYHAASQLGYHLRPTPASEFSAVGRPSKSFPHWWRAAEFSGKNAVVVFDASHFPEGLDLVKRSFDRLEEPIRVPVARFSLGPLGRRTQEFVLVRAWGYRPPPK